MKNIKKILITVLSFLLLFAISCSNEGTTGGDTGNYNYFSVSEEWGNSKDITLATSTVSTAGTVGFSVYGSTSYGISIESVDSGSNPLVLVADDFCYTESTKELTLSYSGLTKYQSASLTAKQKYQYTITFKFTDYSSVDTTDTKTLNVTVNLIKAQIITKTDIENMMKAVKNSDGIYGGNNGEIVFEGSGVPTTFSFASATFSSSTPNFSSTGDTTFLSKNVEITASSKVFSLAYAIANTTQFKEYFGSSVFSDMDYNSTPPSISGKNCTFTIKFKKLQSGYALSSEVSRLMTTGLTIRLTLKDGSVGGQNYTASWK
ncbi:hypothetical protein [Brachyspira sp.]|uniref:hypothetical protein n=1 Tax=Brachyspira sp. TaxID=1977261 RepID=UPI003D7DA272